LRHAKPASVSSGLRLGAEGCRGGFEGAICDITWQSGRSGLEKRKGVGGALAAPWWRGDFNTGR